MTKKAVFFFCGNLDKDPVASHVLEQSRTLFPLLQTGQSVDGRPVLVWERPRRLRLPLRDHRRGAEPRLWPVPFGAERVVRRLRRGGVRQLARRRQRAERSVVRAHHRRRAVGPVGPAAPAAIVSILRAMEECRQGLGLLDFKTSLEATHWSGVQHGQDPRLLLDYAVPLMDIEIGSVASSYGNPRAAEAVARALRAFLRTVARSNRCCALVGCTLSPPSASRS